jgi:hypothetical protein
MSRDHSQCNTAGFALKPALSPDDVGRKSAIESGSFDSKRWRTEVHIALSHSLFLPARALLPLPAR